MGFQLQYEGETCVTASSSIPKVPISRKSNKRVRRKTVTKRKDVSRNEELVFSTFLALQKRNGKRPTRIQVANEIGLSRKKVGQYFKKLNL